jgi:integrase
VTKKVAAGRRRGHIRQRGNSFQVLMYAGIDPVTGKELRLTASASTEAKAQEILAGFHRDIAAQQNARTKATLGLAMDDWLKLHDVEENTRKGYETYIRRYIRPALGDVPVAKITAKVLEEFYAELRRCRVRCDGSPRVDHRTERPHECRVVRHRRPPGRRPVDAPPHDCAAAGCTVTECPPHRCQPLSATMIRHLHTAISATLAAAVRWEWIKSNPAGSLRLPGSKVTTGARSCG